MNHSIQELLTLVHNDESGATATEYIILLTCVACFVIAAVKFFGVTLSEKMGAAEDALSTEVIF